MSIFGPRKDRKAVAALQAELMAAANQPMAGAPVRQITVVNPKGGGNTTTTAVAMAWYLSWACARPVFLCDFNPNKGTARSRLISYPLGGAGSVRELGFDYENVLRPNDLAQYSEIIGRLQVLHNDGVYPELLQQMTLEDYQGVLAVLKEHGQFVVVDTGNAIADPAMTAALASTDLLVFGALAEVDAMYKGLEGADDLIRLGHHDLVANATVVIGVRNPDVVASYVQTGVEWFERSCRATITVGYDPALRGGGLINWAGLRPATESAFLKAALLQTSQLTEWPRSVPRDPRPGNPAVPQPQSPFFPSPQPLAEQVPAFRGEHR